LRGIWTFERRLRGWWRSGPSAASLPPTGSRRWTCRVIPSRRPHERQRVVKGSGNGEPTAGRDLYQGALTASWELDVFGRVRRGVEAADADIDSAEASRRDVMVVPTGGGGEELRGGPRGPGNTLLIADENVRVQQDTVTVTRARQAGGPDQRARPTPTPRRVESWRRRRR